MNKRTALVTAIGSVAGDIVIKSLKKMGWRVVGCDIYPGQWLADSANVDAFYQAPYATDTENYLSFMERVCQAENVEMILPLIDVEVDIFSHNRTWFEEKNIVLCISPRQTLDICRDKKLFQEFVDENCPDIMTIPTSFLRDVDIPEWGFPVVCKPYNGRSSLNLHYINDAEQWKGFTASADPDVYLVQPCVNGSRIVADVVAQGDRAVVVLRRELISTVNGCGTSVYMYRDEQLEEKCRRLARYLGIMGCVNFEFILDEDGQYHIIECNPRFSGGTEFSCLAGYDCVKNHVRCFCGEEIEDVSYGPNRYIARKYEEFVTLVE